MAMRVRYFHALAFRQRGVPLVHFRARGSFELIEQVVGLHAQPAAAAHLDVTPLRILRRKLVAHFRGAARR